MGGRPIRQLSDKNSFVRGQIPTAMMYYCGFFGVRDCSSEACSKMSDQDKTRLGTGGSGGPSAPAEGTGPGPASRRTLVGVGASMKKDGAPGAPQRDPRPPLVTAAGSLPATPVD